MRRVNEQQTPSGPSPPLSIRRRGEKKEIFLADANFSGFLLG
jgi:hypothetical protein